jgi:hypothetical protein
MRRSPFREDDPRYPQLSDEKIFGFICLRFGASTEKYNVRLTDFRRDNTSTSTVPSDFQGVCRCLLYATAFFGTAFGPWFVPILHRLVLSFLALALEEIYPLPLLLRVIEGKLASLPRATLSLAPEAALRAVQDTLVLSADDPKLQAEVLRHMQLNYVPAAGQAKPAKVKAPPRPPLLGEIPCFKWIKGVCPGSTCPHQRKHAFAPGNSTAQIDAFKLFVVTHMK